NFTLYPSNCAHGDKGAGMFATFVGTGKKYILNTCNSHYIGAPSGYNTFVELFETDCYKCVDFATNNCGDDGYIVATLEKGKTYFIRAGCSEDTDECEVTFKMSEAIDTMNYKCETAKEIELRRPGDVYTQIVDGSHMIVSESGCDEIKDRQGSWYTVKAHSNKTPFISGVIPYNSQEFVGFVELRSSCNATSQLCADYNGVSSFVLGGDIKQLSVFASSIRMTGTGNTFGIFMFYSMYGNLESGSTPDTAIKITMPYTDVRLYGNSKLSTMCRSDRKNVPGLYYIFDMTEGVMYDMDTCGDETTNILGIETQGDLYGPFRCINYDEDAVCGNGVKHEVKAIAHPGAKTLVLVYVRDYARVGMGRFSIDVKNATSPNEKCTTAKDISQFPTTDFFKTTNNMKSRSKCNGETNDGLLGVWYTVTAPEDKTLLVYTDDVTQFRSRIDFYEGCQIVTSDSVGQNCKASQTTSTSPKGNHGTATLLKMKAGQKVYVLVSGETAANSGYGKVTFDFLENEATDDSSSSNEKNNNGLSGGAIFGIVFAVIVFVVIIAAIIGVVVFFIVKKGPKTSSHANF
ncbi:hypothetical protein EIN_182140, partial [Entamoeba invadens IP1]|uniref:hypothetical protein n=1 Tax=Entamoeba invadens IP1 TaxID=370355 RepID=UPI0002C3E77B